MLDKLQAFFEENKLALRATESIKDGRQVGLTILPTNGGNPSTFTFTKENGKSIFRTGKPDNPDFSFELQEAAADELTSRSFQSVGQVGLFLFEKKIKINLHIGFLALMSNGYLGVLSAGGADIAKFLASRGLGSLGKLKDAIHNLRS